MVSTRHLSPSPVAPVGDVTCLLLAWSQGDGDALARLMPQVYPELQRVALGYLRRERSDHTLEASGLVHEAFLRLVDQRRVSWQSRAHFYAIAAQMMRRILVDHARRRQYGKRGGGAPRVTLEEAVELPGAPVPLVELDEALDDLSANDAQAGRVVELRFYGGLSNDEIAGLLGVSVPTVARRWRTARAWLYQRLADAGTREA